jgi:hypothetical protein
MGPLLEARSAIIERVYSFIKLFDFLQARTSKQGVLGASVLGTNGNSTRSAK